MNYGKQQQNQSIYNTGLMLIITIFFYLCRYPDCNTNNIYINPEQDLLISYCKNKQNNDGKGSLNISNILTGKLISKICTNNKQETEEICDDQYSVSTHQLSDISVSDSSPPVSPFHSPISSTNIHHRPLVQLLSEEENDFSPCKRRRSNQSNSITMTPQTDSILYNTSVSPVPPISNTNTMSTPAPTCTSICSPPPNPPPSAAPGQYVGSIDFFGGSTVEPILTDPLDSIHFQKEQKELSEALADVTALFYYEPASTLYTGSNEGLLHVWSN
jgi:hypothetical protein